MATGTGKGRCVTCGKEKSAVKCEGCSQIFCFDHLIEHRQQLSLQLDDIEMNRDIFRQTLNEHINDPKKHLLIKQIDQWKEDSINKIQQTAEQCRQLVLQHTNEHFNEMEINLNKLTNQLRETRKENDFNEIELNQFKQKLEQLAKELDKPPNISIQHDSSSFINQISVVMPCPQLVCMPHITNKTKWKQNGITVIGGNGKGNQLNQLCLPYRIYVDGDDQNIYIADYQNNRIVQWRLGANNGQVVTGGNGVDQLKYPTDVIFDRKNNSIIISDCGNRRVVRRSCQNDIHGETIISDIICWGLAMDNNGDLYVSDKEKNEVRRWKIGDKDGTIVAGGNGEGNHLDQLSNPAFIFVDEDYSVYVSDFGNHRVMKWVKGAKEGIIVAGGHGWGHSLAQLTHPCGMVVDQLSNVYVADTYNHRIISWSKGSREGRIVIGGNGKGQEPNQLNHPTDISFDRQGNLYVVDKSNNRVQKFNIDSY